MTINSIPGLSVLLAVACVSPLSPGAQPSPPGQPVPALKPADFKVVVWYRKERPLETFKYQIYDLRKGEFTPAVDAWAKLMRSKYTGYYLSIRGVNLKDEKGETEMLKVGAVVKRELAAAAALDGVVASYAVPGYRLPALPPAPGLPAPATMYRPGFPARSSSGTSDLNPPGYSFPVPVPYPRPHP